MLCISPLNSSLIRTKADPFVTFIRYESGLFFGPGNNSLVMDCADVYYDIEYVINDKHRINCDFEGKFIISNLNETINVTMCIPDTPRTNLQISLNGSLVNFTSIWISDLQDDEQWLEVLEYAFGTSSVYVLQSMSVYYLLLFNATFEAFSNTTLEYSYNYSTSRGPVEFMTGGCDRNLYPFSIA